MTDDIVTRLRDEQWVWVSESALREDAADEIERLRKERDHWMKQSKLLFLQLVEK